MIISEILEDGRIRHYSDLNYCIRQVETGIIYYDAVDVIPCKYTYEETDIPVDEPVDPEEDLDWEIAMQIILGEISGDEV